MRAAVRLLKKCAVFTLRLRPTGVTRSGRECGRSGSGVTEGGMADTRRPLD